MINWGWKVDENLGKNISMDNYNSLTVYDLIKICEKYNFQMKRNKSYSLISEIDKIKSTNFFINVLSVEDRDNFLKLIVHIVFMLANPTPANGNFSKSKNTSDLGKYKGDDISNNFLIIEKKFLKILDFFCDEKIPPTMFEQAIHTVDEISVLKEMYEGLHFQLRGHRPKARQLYKKLRKNYNKERFGKSLLLNYVLQEFFLTYYGKSFNFKKEVLHQIRT